MATTGLGAQDGEILDGLWYLVAASNEIPAGALRRRILFGAPVVLGRTKTGRAFALADVCPHRAAPLSGGRLTEKAGRTLVACPYHGWAFDAENGACAAIPALPSDVEFETNKIRVRSYLLAEANGVIWLYHGEGAPPPAPEIGLAASFRPKTVTRVSAAAPYDEAVIGLIDPAHTPYVHRQWWWREGAPLKDKTKHYEPTALGFKMPAHRPSSNSRIYSFIGGAPTTEIEFRLPAVRIETIRAGARTVLGLTGMTPAEDGRVDILHCVFWDLPLLDIARPLLRRMADNFLGQDGAILNAQDENLTLRRHRPLYVGDADELAKWYFRLKRAWRDRDEGAGFVNPIAPTTLRWRT